MQGSISILYRLQQLLVCPDDRSSLVVCEGGLGCSTCARTYQIRRGIVTFVSSEADRPGRSVALADDIARNSPDLLHVDYYRDRLRRLQLLYETNAAIRQAVDLITGATGTVVDIATGPGGGFVPWLASRLDPETLLVATDACLPVINNWYECLSEVRTAVAFLDIDLFRPLCFRDDSIDLFTGVAIENVNLNEPVRLLSELARCLKPQARAVLQQLFYANESRTADMLRRRGNPYASLSDFGACLASCGLELMETIEVRTGRGKLHPADALPLDENDGWSDHILFLRKP